MTRRIVWATDGSDGADLALAVAVDLAKAGYGRIVALHVDQRLVGRAGGWPAIPDEDDRLDKIRRQVEMLRHEGIDIDLVVRRGSAAPATRVAAAAQELHADLIVCGTHGRHPLAGAVLGSVAQGLLHEATCPVLAVPERAVVVPVAAPEAVPA